LICLHPEQAKSWRNTLKCDIPIDLLVNNAGFGLRGEFRDLSLPRQLEMLRLNNEAIVELTYSLLRECWSDGKRDHQHLLDGGLSAHPLCERLFCDQGLPDHVFSSPGQELRSAGVTVVTVCPGRLRKTQNGESEQPAPGNGPAFTRVQSKSSRRHCEYLPTGAA